VGWSNASGFSGISTFAPGFVRGEDVLVIGHGNSLRALCLVLDRLSHAEVEALNIPTGHPLAYRFAPDLVPLVPGGEYLNPLAARTAAALVAAAGGT
jgi:2,3-bisphosphoglycerate-dependent phosphoglycerate mutase